MNSSATMIASPAQTAGSRPHIDSKTGPVTALVFVCLLVVGLIFSGMSPGRPTSARPGR